MTDLADRYGTRSSPRWLWWVVAGAGIAVGVAWAAWIALQPRPVSTDIYSYDVVSDTQIDLVLEVVREEPVAVTCSVYAQAQDHSIVGEKTVTVPASQEKIERQGVTLTTTERAVTGVVRSCEVSD
ncbi:DUF4307 domain-containing protein [Aeromicrobium sp. Leaf350]|uniref:DUF4307 domain-containing protein n=1 Tax=Aeromicrobium sp. Leaf350 TaxID=2876565 RepID=UPI001E4C4446|nr:DUF4307 domain-containing protein [Aeromicrobium sp. Leaf350]